MAASRVAISSLTNGTILQAGTYLPAVGATAFVYQHGTTTQVTVFSAEAGGTTLSQPLTTNSNAQVPGYVLAEQDVDVVASYGGQTATAAAIVPVRAADIVGADPNTASTVIGVGNVGLPSTVPQVGVSATAAGGAPGRFVVIRSDGTIGYLDHVINLMGWQVQYPNLGNGTSPSDDTNAIQAWASAVIAAGAHGVAPAPTASNYLLNRTVYLGPPAGSASCIFTMEWFGNTAVKSFLGPGTDAHRQSMFYCAGWKEGTHVKGLSGSVISATNTVLFEVDNAATTLAATYAPGQTAGTFIKLNDSTLMQVGQTLTLSAGTANSEVLTIATVPTTTVTGTQTVNTTPSSLTVGSTTGWPATGTFYQVGTLITYTSIVDGTHLGGCTIASGSISIFSGLTIKSNAITFTGATAQTHTTADVACSPFISFSQCVFENCFLFIPGNQPGSIGWRVAHTDNLNLVTQSDFSFIGWENCGFDSTAATGNGDSTAQIGWALEGDNVLNNYWHGGFCYLADKNITTNPTTGCPRTASQTRASITTEGFGSSNNGYCDFEITALGCAKIIGGRSERGTGRFAIIGASASSTVPVNASFASVEIADYAGKGGYNAGGELITVQGASTLVLDAVDIQTADTLNSGTHGQWGANMIAATNTSTAPGTVTVRDSLICAVNPFIAASGLWQIRTPNNQQTSTPWPATAVGAFFDPSSFATCSVPTVRGSGYFYEPSFNSQAIATSGNGTLRLVPFYLSEPITISQMFAEFTAAGDAASIVATAIYADNGAGFPGALLVTGPTISTGTGNAGTVSTGGTPGVYQGAPQSGSVVSAGIATLPSGLYWGGGVVQGVTVTQPTIRTRAWGAPPIAFSALPGTATTPISYAQTSITGALPNPFAGAVGPSNTNALGVGFKVP